MHGELWGNSSPSRTQLLFRTSGMVEPCYKCSNVFKRTGNLDLKAKLPKQAGSAFLWTVFHAQTVACYLCSKALDLNGLSSQTIIEGNDSALYKAHQS